MTTPTFQDGYHRQLRYERQMYADHVRYGWFSPRDLTAHPARDTTSERWTNDQGGAAVAGAYAADVALFCGVDLSHGD